MSSLLDSWTTTLKHEGLYIQKGISTLSQGLRKTCCDIVSLSQRIKPFTFLMALSRYKEFYIRKGVSTPTSREMYTALVRFVIVLTLSGSSKMHLCMYLAFEHGIVLGQVLWASWLCIKDVADKKWRSVVHSSVYVYLVPRTTILVHKECVDENTPYSVHTIISFHFGWYCLWSVFILRSRHESHPNTSFPSADYIHNNYLCYK